MSKDEADLAQKTLNYWRVSLCWNGKSNSPVTTEFALDTLGDIMDQCGPSRPLLKKVTALRHHIIIGGKPNGRRHTG